MYELRELLPAGLLPAPTFDQEPVRWGLHRHQRRVRSAMIVAVLLAAMTSLGVCMAGYEASQGPRPSRIGTTVQIPDDRSAAHWAGPRRP